MDPANNQEDPSQMSHYQLAKNLHQAGIANFQVPTPILQLILQQASQMGQKNKGSQGGGKSGSAGGPSGMGAGVKMPYANQQQQNAMLAQNQAKGGGVLGFNQDGTPNQQTNPSSSGSGHVTTPEETAGNIARINSDYTQKDQNNSMFNQMKLMDYQNQPQFQQGMRVPGSAPSSPGQQTFVPGQNANGGAMNWIFGGVSNLGNPGNGPIPDPNTGITDTVAATPDDSLSRGS